MERPIYSARRDIRTDFTKDEIFELRIETLVDLWQVQRNARAFQQGEHYRQNYWVKRNL